MSQPGYGLLNLVWRNFEKIKVQTEIINCYDECHIRLTIPSQQWYCW